MNNINPFESKVNAASGLNSNKGANKSQKSNKDSDSIFSRNHLEGDLRLIDSLLNLDPKNEKLTNAKQEYELFLNQGQKDNDNTINA